MKWRLWLVSLLAVNGLVGCAAVVVTGVGVTALALDDRRTIGTQVEDEGIEQKLNAQILERYGQDAPIHLNAVSFNRIVLLMGQIPDETKKAEIEKLARGIPNVRLVQNELTIGQPSTLSTRSNDAWITSKVKSRMVEAKELNANRIKVCTESGVVFLMGLVANKEAEIAVEIARTTSGVVKVVKVFEYTNG